MNGGRMDSPSDYRHILIVADIDGRSGFWSYAGAAFMTRQWVHACTAMTADVGVVARALRAAGVPAVTVKDFHRIGFNLKGRLGMAWLRHRCRRLTGSPVGPN